MKRILMLVSCLILSVIFSQMLFAEELIVENEDEYILMGDVDDNNVVNAADALKLLKIISKTSEMNNRFSIRKNDFNKDYMIDAEDALTVLKIGARIEEIKKINDSNNFFKTIENEKGYPISDYVSKNIDSNVELSIDEGVMDKLYWDVRFRLINGGILDDDMKWLTTVKYSDVIAEYYWKVNWFIQDSISDERYTKTEISQASFERQLSDEGVFNGCRIYVKSYLEPSSVLYWLYISDENEIYFAAVRRCDYFFSEDWGTIYKYEGEVPACLTYEAVMESYGNFE